MSKLFEVKNDNKKIVISDDVPNLQVVYKSKLNSMPLQREKDFYGQYTQFIASDIDAFVYIVGIDVSELPDGTYCFDGHETNGSTSIALNVFLPSKATSAVNPTVYGFGEPTKPTEHMTGIEIYDTISNWVVFTSKSGTQYPKVVKMSSETTDSFTIKKSPTIFANTGWVVGIDGPSPRKEYRASPKITKKGNTVTVQKYVTGDGYLSLSGGYDAYNWLVFELLTIK